jgi:hypothetical protein
MQLSTLKLEKTKSGSSSHKGRAMALRVRKFSAKGCGRRSFERFTATRRRAVESIMPQTPLRAGKHAGEGHGCIDCAVG